MELGTPDKSKAAFTLVLTQFLDGTCGIDSHSENGEGMRLIDVRQLLQWGLNRVNDEIMMSAVKNLTKVNSAIIVPVK